MYLAHVRSLAGSALRGAIFCGVLFPISQAMAREIHYDERVKAQEAIERFYYSHQIDAKRSFGRAVGRGLIERKVRTYLAQSAMLERQWGTPITGEALDRELERIARDTRFPDRLQDLYRALDGDAVLIKECFARAVLVDRLARNFFAYDSGIQGQAREEAKSLHDQLVAGTIAPDAPHPRRFVERTAQFPSYGAHGAGTAGQPAPNHGSGFVIGALEESPEALTIRVAPRNDEAGAAIVYLIPKISWDEWWKVNSDATPLSAEATAAASFACPRPGTVH